MALSELIKQLYDEGRKVDLMIHPNEFIRTIAEGFYHEDVAKEKV